MLIALRSIVAALLPLAMTLALAGCHISHSAGNLRSQSLRTNSVILPGDYRVGVFSSNNIAGTSILLSDVPIEQVVSGQVINAQILHIELLWLPKAGETPMDSSATNASIRHIVISNGQVGIYAGAGFAQPDKDPAGNDSVTVTLRDASLALQESTSGFVDLLSPTRLTGTFTAQRDDKRARQLYFAISQLVTNAFGRTRYVMNDQDHRGAGGQGGAGVSARSVVLDMNGGHGGPPHSPQVWLRP